MRAWLSACMVIVWMGCSNPAQPSPTAAPAAPAAALADLAKVAAPAPAAPKPPPLLPPPPGPALELAAKADQALTEDIKFDYSKPISDDGHERVRQREPIRLAYLKACQAGDRRSCWMAMEISTSIGADRRDAEAKMNDNCRAGDVMSCRAIDLHTPVGADLPHTAAARECVGGRTCDLAALRRACMAGFPFNCMATLTYDAHPSDVAEISTIGRKSAREGCTLGITKECQTLEFLSRDDARARADYLFALEQHCTIDLFGCNDWARANLGVDPVKARDAYERGCRFERMIDTISDSCEPLWHAYLDPTSGFTEPVSGRAKQLHDWACKKYKQCWKKS